MEKEIIKVKCPSCGKVLKLSGAIDNPNASFCCKGCGEKHKISECEKVVVSGNTELPYKPAAVAGRGNETLISPMPHAVQSSAGGDKTIIREFPANGGFEGTRQMISCGCLIDRMGNRYPLSLGENSVGRMARTSTAKIQLPPLDATYDYMSRNHVIIEVRDCGGAAVHILRNSSNKNSTLRNGKQVDQTAQIVLNDGDIITLGKTNLTFKK